MAAYSIDAALQPLIDAQQPAEKAVSYFYPLNGLSGLSGRVVSGRQQWLARRVSPTLTPFISRQREWRILRRLASRGLAPRALAINAHWLLLEWLPGKTLSPDRFAQCQPELVALLTRLHSQPLSGYRLRLLPLLQHYWLQCRDRHARWLRQLRRLARRGEPAPLRLGLLHMDIHPGNLLEQPAGLRLIDWEYAADGDVSLELTAIIGGNAMNAIHGHALLNDYARANRIDPDALRRQVARWRPWLQLLMASWYQLRWEQSSDDTLHKLAIDAWRQV